MDGRMRKIISHIGIALDELWEILQERGLSDREMQTDGFHWLESDLQRLHFRLQSLAEKGDE